MVHFWDDSESWHQRWRGCPNHRGSPAIDGSKCLQFGNRFAASIISRQKHPICEGVNWCTNGGLVFRPEFNRLLCAYPTDMATIRFREGCPRPFCDRAVGAKNGFCNGLPHDPRDLDNMLRWWTKYGQSYNEVLVDIAYYDARLPHSVAAIIGDRNVHEQFVEFYKVDPKDYPLVGLDRQNLDHPFHRLSE